MALLTPLSAVATHEPRPIATDAQASAKKRRAPAVKSPANLKPASALPLQTVAEELSFLLQNFRDVVAAYTYQVEGEITHLQNAVLADAGSRKKLPATRLADLRDMLMLLRSTEVKPARGKRRDLKKLENLICDLREISDRW